MKLLFRVGEILIMGGFTACGLVAAALLVIGALGFAIVFGMCVAWDWFEERDRGC